MKKIWFTIIVVVVLLSVSMGSIWAENLLTYSNVRDKMVCIDQGLTVEQLNKLADLVVNSAKKDCELRGGKMAPGQIARIWYDEQSSEFVAALHQKLMAEGLNVQVVVAPYRKIWDNFMANSSDAQWSWIPPWCDSLSKSLSYQFTLNCWGLDNDLVMMYNSDGGKILSERDAKGEYTEMLCALPNETRLATSGLSQEEYFQGVAKEYLLDKDNPLDEFAKIDGYKSQLIDWLNGLSLDYIQIKSDNADLKVPIGNNRTWLKATVANLPSFEVYTSPDWRGVEGTYSTVLPIFLNDDPAATKANLTFKKGEAESVDFQGSEEGVAKIQKYLAAYKDAGSLRLGELAFTDKRLSPITKSLGDAISNENVAGTMHVALGRAFPSAYAGSQEPDWEALGLNVQCPTHFDIVNNSNFTAVGYTKDGKKIELYANGQFCFEFKDAETTLNKIVKTCNEHLLGRGIITPMTGHGVINWQRGKLIK